MSYFGSSCMRGFLEWFRTSEAKSRARYEQMQTRRAVDAAIHAANKSHDANEASLNKRHEMKAHVTLGLRDGGQRNNDYQQGYYDGVSKCREMVQRLVDVYLDPNDIIAMGQVETTLRHIDALLHPQPAV
jgi:hypothetical protein